MLWQPREFPKSHEYSNFYSKLFAFAIDHMKYDIEGESKDALPDLVIHRGDLRDDGWHYLSIGSVFDEFSIPKDKVVSVLLIGISILFRNNYNIAIDKLNSRDISLDKSDYFSF